MSEAALENYSLSDEEYQAVTGERRCEYIDGVIYDLASPSKGHQAISGRLYIRLDNHLAGKDCAVYTAPYDVKIDDDRLQPDLLIQCKGRKMPTVVIEILSDSDKRHILKKRGLYESSGIKEYWEINPASCTMTLYEYEKRQKTNFDEAIDFYSPAMDYKMNLLELLDEAEAYAEKA